MKRLLIIGDEESVSITLKDDFEKERYAVTLVTDGKIGLDISLDHEFDMILLDIINPDIDGIELCKTLRRNRVLTPIIIISSKRSELDKVLGLEIGADDYVTKPFSSWELQARVKAVLRRVQIPNHLQYGSIFEFGNISIDFHGHEVRKNGMCIKLTAKEFSLLRFIIENRSKVVSRDEILDHVWNPNVIVDPRTVDTHVANLRKKIEDSPSNPKWIIGVRGAGYKFVAR